jgi:BirA family transcriptional regulator, biotin operon repressor / biotin---[acetyl-CoA-carboxylase] ligase
VADSLAPGAVEPKLRGRFGRPYLYAETTASTQRMLEADVPEGAVAVAEEQTEGRGRLGRRWEAPRGSSVLVSIVLEPAVQTDRLPELSLVAGRAVAAAVVETTGVAPTVRFPNDVLIGGKKVAGILAEASGTRVVLGIGVNVNQAVEALPKTGTSLYAETGTKVDRGGLLASVLASLEREYDAWLSGSGASR